MRTVIIYLSILTILPFLLNAQETNLEASEDYPTSSVGVIAERTDDKIIVRWAPSDPQLWLICNIHGYRVERMKVDKESKNPDGIFSLIGTKKPMGKEAWKKYIIDYGLPEYPSVALECIYSDYTSLSLGEGMGAWVEQAGELSNKYSFALFAADMDQKTAEMSGLLYEDRNIQKGEAYIYKVTPLVPKSEYLIFSSGAVLVGPENTPYQPINFHTNIGDGSITLNWTRDVYKRMYTAYYIERSSDGKTFEAVHEKPYINAVSSDSTIISPYISYIDKVENYKNYSYRVVGITPFGNKGPYSPVIKAMGRDLTPPKSPDIKKADHIGDRSVEITWEYEDDKDATGFNVYRGHKYDDNFYKLTKTKLPKKTRSYTDKAALLYDRNYYYVAAVDSAGNEGSSFITYGVIKDSIPPNPPTGLKAVVDTTGVVTLTWDPGIEPDILGYKIFFANADHHEFSLITGRAVKARTYTDTLTLKTLTRHAYYKIMAVDKRYNYSKFSEIIEVVRPDTIPPTSPIFTDYRVDKEHIFLEWAPSHSLDLSHHELLRKENDEAWQVVSTNIKTETEYKDSDINPGASYQYKIIAIDESGLRSRAAYIIYLESVDIILKEGINKIEITHSDKGHPILNWNYPSAENHDFVIYRSTQNSGLDIIQILDKTKKDFVDKTAKKDIVYKYTMRVRFEGGAQSKYSPIQEAQVIIVSSED